jgi:hypothetical protein
MKLNMFKITAIVMMVAGSVSSCGKRSEAGGEVPYKPCSCEEGKPSVGLFPTGEAYLFKNYIPEQMANQISEELSDASHKVCWMVYYSETDDVFMWIGNLNDFLFYHGKICNFPDFAKKWAIPENGCKVDFEGLMYETCSGGLTNVIPFEDVLTKLK